MDWQEILGNAVLLPPRPKAIVHFLGGAFVAANPQIAYRWLLEPLARRGYAVVATPFLNTFDHAAIARDVLNRFEQALERLRAANRIRKSLPIYNIGHSMGSKLHFLCGSLFDLERAGTISISFNNFPVRRSIPFAEQIPALMSVEFVPSPEQTFDLIDRNYGIRRNLLIKFKRDELDQTSNLDRILQARFQGFVSLRILEGTHTTPLAQDMEWTIRGSFSALDAVAQWMRQEMNRDLYRLQREILLWLDPTQTF